MLVSKTYIGSYSDIRLFTTMIMFIYIFINAKRQENRIHQGTASDGSVAEKKVAKTIFTVVGIYALCPCFYDQHMPILQQTWPEAHPD